MVLCALADLKIQAVFLALESSRKAREPTGVNHKPEPLFPLR